MSETGPKFEIKNRVASSKLETIDLEDFYPEGQREVLDIKSWLLEDTVLQERKFRAHAKAYNWAQYQNAYLCLTCSVDAIIPSWAYMLLITYASPYATKTIVGDVKEMETLIYKSIIDNLDLTKYKDSPVIIKGCSKKPVPQNAYLFLIEKLQPIAKSLMFGEACSSVPLYKRK